MPLIPKAAAEEESDDRRRGEEEVERYERLRRAALGGERAGFELGLALLRRRGVVAWARAWREAGGAAARAGARPEPAIAPPAAASDELVGALAEMALACVAAG